MSVCGLITEAEGGYTLSAAAQAMMTGQRAKDDTATRLARLRQQLTDFDPKGKHPGIRVTQEQLLGAQGVSIETPSTNSPALPGFLFAAAGKTQNPNHRLIDHTICRTIHRT